MSTKTICVDEETKPHSSILQSNPTETDILAQRFQQATKITLAGLEASFRKHLPESTYKDFSLWAISTENPYRDIYLEAMGMTQLIQLTVKLPENLVDEQRWQRLVQYCAAINAYFTYEIVSDNLALGLTNIQEDDPKCELRRNLVYKFNQAMVARLSGESQHASQLLDPLLAEAGQVSIFHQSLTRHAHYLLARTYIEAHNHTSVEELEYAAWPLLVANIEAGFELADVIQTEAAKKLVRKGLQEHYSHANYLMDDEIKALPDLMKACAHTVLVIPTLAYYSAALAEITENQESLVEVIEDGTLMVGLYNAALLVRLLNDLGTELITSSPKDRADLLFSLLMNHEINPQGYPELGKFLVDAAEAYPQLSRLRKDILLGEFNIGVEGLQNSQPVPFSLTSLWKRLDYFSQVYAHRRSSLMDNLSLVSSKMGDNKVSELILRFVQFHEIMYSQKGSGEYTL